MTSTFDTTLANLGISRTGTSTPTVAPAGSGSQTLGQADFLKLMTAQMQNQDPFNPVDNTQMVAQMAQFSQTTGIAEMNQSLKSMVQSLQQSRVADAANWIGKAALVPSKAASALADGSFAGNVTLPDAASRVDISLVDGSGTVVYTGSATNVPAGDVPFYWDGKDQEGNPVAGPLTIVASAKDSQAQAMADITTSSWATVASVSSPASGSTKIVTPLGNFDPADALQLS